MQVVESFSGRKPNGKSDPKQPGVYMPAVRFVKFRFDTGHTYEVFDNGVEFFTSAGQGRLLNENKGDGVKLVPEMRRLAKASMAA